jgi:hypothetical protein
MKRNLIPGLQKVDWSDAQRQNEFVNSVVSALNALGENLDYDYVCAVSGSAFRASFGMSRQLNHGNYHAVNAPVVIEHIFKMSGYDVSRHVGGDFETNCRLVTDSIDRGVPVITLEGVINCSDACVVSGYDNDGKVLLGYNPFMYVEDDHGEAPDESGYFRKSDWHGDILIIGAKREKPGKQTIFAETMKIVSKLILEESLCPGQYNGLAAHKAFADALMTYEWTDNFEPYLNVMCNYKQYIDRQYAVKFFEDNGRNDLAGLYGEIAGLCAELGKIIPQDFSASDMFGDREKLRPYCEILLEIRDIEKKAAEIIVSKKN